jgi:hypothetical protein
VSSKATANTAVPMACTTHNLVLEQTAPVVQPLQHHRPPPHISPPSGERIQYASSVQAALKGWRYLHPGHNILLLLLANG